MSADFLHFLSFFVPVCGLIGLLLGCVALLASGLHPFTAIGRAKIKRLRALNARQAELILRGYDEYSAKNIAESELQEEAREQTRTLRTLGVES